MNIAATNFSDQFLTDNFYRFKTEYSNKFIKDSLTDQNFSGYLNKYDTRIYTYDSVFHPLFNDDSAKYSTIKTLILTQGKITTIPGLYSYENAGGSSGYIYEKQIKQADSDGYLFVVVKPKKYVSEALFPELFKQTQDISVDLNTDYTYAVYSNGKIELIDRNMDNVSLPFISGVDTDEKRPEYKKAMKMAIGLGMTSISGG